jgi:hypothetical protein
MGYGSNRSNFVDGYSQVGVLNFPLCIVIDDLACGSIFRTSWWELQRRFMAGYQFTVRQMQCEAVYRGVARAIGLMVSAMIVVLGAASNAKGTALHDSCRGLA